MKGKVWLAVLLVALVAAGGCARRAKQVQLAAQLQEKATVTQEKATVAQEKAAVAAAQDKSTDVPAFDDFNGKLGLKWDIVHPDPTHYSLTKKPGHLTITTQAGGFAQGSTDYKNLFLIDCPSAPGKDLQVTIGVSDFKPQGDYNQVGLVFWNDEDNYIKWDYEWSGKRVLNAIGEVNGQWPRHKVFDPPAESEKLWLRAIKHGNRYVFEASTDGKTFTRAGDDEWGDGSVKKVGFYAKNGPGSQAPEIDATFESFEVKAVPASGQ